MQLAVEHPQQGGLLAAVVGGVGDTAGHDPGPAALDLEEVPLRFPPRLVALAQGGQGFCGVPGVEADKASRFSTSRRGRSVTAMPNIDANQRFSLTDWWTMCSSRLRPRGSVG